MLDKNPFVIKEFRGTNRGSVNSEFDTFTQDTIGFSEAVAARNVHYLKEGGFRTRVGCSNRITDPAFNNFQARQHWKISNLGGVAQSDRWLILKFRALDNSGYFYDTNHLGAPILVIAGCKYASVINIFGRLYISPLSDFGVPLAGEKIYVHTGGTTARAAGGSAPVGATLAVTEVTVAGANVTPGLHLCAIAFETDTGFITPPGPSVWKQITISGSGTGSGKAIRFSNVDIGPAGTVARHLLVSRIVLSYDGIQTNWELFFGLKIPDNIATTGDVVVPDTGLVVSAAYLLDEFSEIPSCAAISNYGPRLMYNGSRTDKRVIYVSKPSDPESVDQTEGFIQINEGIPVDVYNGKELRGIYYMFKETSSYLVREDINIPPNQWRYELVDSGLGAVPMGIAEVMANPGGLVFDNLLVTSLAGIHIFNGTFSQVPISLNIQSLFDFDFTRDRLKYTRIAVDPVKKLLYVMFGDPNASGDSKLYVGNYFNGLTPDTIKWALWDFKGKVGEVPVLQFLFPVSIYVDPNPAGSTQFSSALSFIINDDGADQFLWETRDNNLFDDVDVPISWDYETGFTENELEYVYTFTHLRMRIQLDANGDPNTTVTLEYGLLDDGGSLNSLGSLGPTQGLNALPGKPFTIPINVTSEKMRIKISGFNQVQIQKLILFVAERAKDRPR